ncbi:MAG: V-type ATPase subunit [Clostridia bacterium]|nr:V-type ATPase subunit [Clostridia bacterium]
MKMPSQASNALLAKCRAIYGRRLGREAYDSLISCRSVSDVASQLSQTHYAPAIAGLDQTSIHRGQLEAALGAMLYEELAGLCRYEQSLGTWISGYIIMRGEISQLLEFLKLLAAGRPGEYIFSLPDFFKEHTDLDLNALAMARSYRDMLVALKGTVYAKILIGFAPKEGQPFDIAMIEHALYEKLYYELINTINKNMKGKPKDEMLELVGTQIDLINFSHIYRLKRYYRAGADLVRRMTFRNHYKLSQKTAEAMAQTADADEVMRLLCDKTPYGKQINGDMVSEGYAEQEASRLLAKKARHLLRFSISPPVVLMAFSILAETELRDVVTIIEGVRYGLAPDEIRALTVLRDHE